MGAADAASGAELYEGPDACRLKVRAVAAHAVSARAHTRHPKQRTR